METNFEIHALPHPDPRVRRVGFDPSHPYVEQCWGAVIGPSSVAILRRASTLWSEQEPARIPVHDLGRSLGLAASGEGSRFHKAVDRLVRFNFGVWLDRGSAVAIYTEVPPLGHHRLDQVPDWTRAAHERLLGVHLDRIAAVTERGPQVADITARLDRLERPRQRDVPPGAALGR